MKILVTGAAGYVGSLLVTELAALGNTVHAYGPGPETEVFLQYPGIKLFTGDIRDRKSLTTAMRGCSQVYHTDGTVKSRDRNPDLLLERHVGGTTNVLKVAADLEISRMVYTSSCAVWSATDNYLLTENDPRVGSFDNDYTLSKCLAEKAVKEYCYKGLDVVIVNPSRLYGPPLIHPEDGVNRIIQWLLCHRMTPVPCHPDIRGNYAFIQDVVKGHRLAMEKGTTGERYILGGENISFRQFLEIIRKNGNRRKIYCPLPDPVLKAWSFLEVITGRLLNRDPLLTPGILKRLQRNKIMDSGKAVRQLGYAITPFESGLQHTIDHLKKTIR